MAASMAALSFCAIQTIQLKIIYFIILENTNWKLQPNARTVMFPLCTFI